MTPDDKKIWEEFLASVHPLKKEKKVQPHTKKTEKISKEPTGQIRQDFKVSASAPAKIHQGQDRALCRKLKKGTVSIEGRLDLHGYTQKEALRALEKFLAHLSAAHKRVGIIITGKGQLNQNIETEIGRGVLRRQLPIWLCDPVTFPQVLSLSQALPEHGGAGAFYVEVRI